jgi:hypothetical protein
MASARILAKHDYVSNRTAGVRVRVAIREAMLVAVITGAAQRHGGDAPSVPGPPTVQGFCK